LIPHYRWSWIVLPNRRNPTGGQKSIQIEWPYIRSEQVFDADDMLFALVRHGTTKLNEEDKFRGWSDDDAAALDSKGIKQAKVAGRFLSKMPVKFGMIISSDLDRALHTSAIIGSMLQIKDIHTDERLRPLNVGDFTGEDKEESDIDFYLENPDESFPNGESVGEFRDRQKDFSKDLFQWIVDHPDEEPIVVGHLSNVIYWEDLNKSLKGYMLNYSTTKEDLIHPGGIVAVMPDDKVIPILGENKKFDESDKGEE